MNARLAGAALVAIVGSATMTPVQAQGIPASDGALAVGGAGAGAYGGGTSYGFSSYTPANSSFPLTYYGFGRPAIGPVGQPILGGGTGGYGYGFGFPAIGAAAVGSPVAAVGGIGFPSYGYPVGTTVVGSGGFLGPFYGFGSSYTYVGYNPPLAPLVPSGVYNPLLPVGLTPLAVQSALGERSLVDRVGVSKTFASTAKSGPLAPSARQEAARPSLREGVPPPPTPAPSPPR